MTFSEEVLMAYADGELDPQTRAAVDAALATDPEIARRVAQHAALRSKLSSAFDEVLNEQIPDRLVRVAREAPTTRREATVIPLRTKSARSAARWSLPQWGAIAASLAVGVIGSQLFLRYSASGPVVERNGRLLANAGLAQALSEQLASNQQPQAPVQIGVSFRSKSGDYCRTFALHDNSALAGLACHAGEQWRVQVLAQRELQSGDRAQYRPAGSSLPNSVLQAVTESIDGDTMDAPAETAARDKGWVH